MRYLIYFILLFSLPATANIGPFPGATSSSSGGGGGTGTVTGTGTASRFSKWSSSTALTSTLWAEGSSGEFQFQNFTAAKGTAAAPVVDLAPATGAGLFTDSNKSLLFSANGVQLGQFTSTGSFQINQSGTTSNSLTGTISGSGVLWSMAGATNTWLLRGKDRTSSNSLYFQDSNGNNLLTFDADGDTASVPGQWVMSSLAGRIMQGANLGIGVGAATSKWNKFTISSNGDITNVRGTTTVNASTTVTGSSTKFTTDFGIGDYIAVSTVPSGFSRITAIASDTSMTVATAIGNGTSQTMNKKQSPFRVASPDMVTTFLQVDPFGKTLSGNYVMSPFEVDASNSGTALTIDFTNGSSQKITMTGNCTLTITNPQAGGSYVLRLVQDATGSRTMTWPAAVKWSGGTAPTLTITAAKIDIINLYYDGTNYYGSYSLNY